MVYQCLYEKLKEIYPAEEIGAMSRIIIADRLGIDRLKLITSEVSVDSSSMAIVEAIADELSKGKPLQYILGETTFYNLCIKVTPATLIPRPETEELVDIIVKENRTFNGKIFDIGTGSGCIAIALAGNIPCSKVYASDYSAEAIEVATSNALLNGVEVTFLQDNILDSRLDENFDIIVSNPPYVCESEKAVMAANVLDFEPHTALFVSDNNPLLYYKAILNFAKNSLRTEGKLYFEINERLGNEMRQLLLSSGYTEVEIRRDLSGRERFAVARKL